MKILCLLSGILLFIVFNGFSQTGVGDYQSGFKTEGNTVSLTDQNAELRIEFCTPSMVRIRASWDKTFDPPEQWMVAKYDWPRVDIKTSDEGDHFLLSTDQLSIHINKAPFSIRIYASDGQLLNSEVLNSGKGGMYKEDNSVMCLKKLMTGEHFFGFGERMDFLDRRGKKLKLNVGRGEGMPHIIGAYNILKANYCPVPFFMSTEGYGIFFHNAYPTTWDMGSADPTQYSFAAEGGAMDYYFIYGPGFHTIMEQYTELTGRSPLLPEFALGLHVGTYSGGTWGYEELTSDQYVIDLGRKFRQKEVPADVLHLDSTWRIFGDTGGKGATTFEWRSTFKNPKGMFDSLYAMNYKMVGLHIRPRFDNGKTLKLLDSARAKGYTYPEKDNPGEFVNFFDPKAVDWWWNNGVMKVASIGAKFLKTDEGSAFGARANESDKVGPTGKDIARLHNLFPIAYAKAPYEKFQQYNGIRGMNHTREGYAGIQRYPFIFAGDWPSEWQYFAPVIKAGLNISLSGVGYWAHCMGGFEHEADPELYIRWTEFGLLSPVAHIFGMDHPGYKEPWNYGEEAFEIFKRYDQLRYRLIPYLYSNTWVQYKTGLPLMRALVFDYQDDVNVYDIADQYIFGNNIMVCPVTEKGAQTRVVYLPEGQWFDYWTGIPYSGKQYINVVAPLDKIPIFVKAGSIIPTQPQMIYFGQKPVDVITLDIFPSGSSSFQLYEDDGLHLGYQKGEFSLTDIESELSSGKLNLTINMPEGQYKPEEHHYEAKVHWNGSDPTNVTENGKSVTKLNAADDLENSEGWYFDPSEKIVWIKTKNTNKGKIELEVE